MLDWVIYSQNKRKFPNIVVKQLRYFSHLPFCSGSRVYSARVTLYIFFFKLWFSGRETWSARLGPLKFPENVLWKQGSSRVYTLLLWSSIVAWQSKLLCQGTRVQRKKVQSNSGTVNSTAREKVGTENMATAQQQYLETFFYFCYKLPNRACNQYTIF